MKPGNGGGAAQTAAEVDGPDPLGPGLGGAAVARLLRSPLLRSSLVYVGSSLLDRAVPFLLLPVLTRYLSPADVGITGMYVAAVAIMAPLVGLSTDAAASRRYVDRDEIDYPSYLTNCLYVLLATALVVAAVVVPLSRPLGALLAVPAEWVWTLVVVAAGRFVVSILLGLWRMRQRPGAYAAFSFAVTVLGLGISVFLIVGRDLDWRGRVLGEVVSLAVMGAVGMVLIARGGWLRGGVNREYLSDALRYGTGLVPHVYGGLLIATTDRLFVSHMVGVHQTGLYMVGVQVAMLIGVLQQSFNQAWAPWLYEVLKRNDAAELRKVRRFTRVYNAGILMLALALAAASPWLLRFLVGPEFRGAAQFILWLALASAFSGMYKMVVNPVFYAGRTRSLSAITLVSGLANLVFNYVLITANGAVGAAQATALSTLLSYLLTARLAARVSRELAAAGPA